MSNLDWQTSDGVTLKSLRQSAGIGLSVLAKKASLSVEQLKQLEEGGSSLFYTEAIKLRAGERVLSILGFRFTEPEAKIQDQNNPTHRIIPVKAQTAPWIESLSLAKAFLSRQLSLLFERITPTLGIRGQSVLSSLWHSSMLWVLMGTLATVLLCYDFYLQGVQRGWSMDDLTALIRDPGTRVSLSARNEAPPNLAAPQLNSNSSNSIHPINGVEEAIAPVAREIQVDSSPCHWQADSPSLSALHPSKLGNFVHITAISQTQLCIMDSRNKVSVLTLVGGSSQSVYGAAPFKVYSENLKHLKFYFQGYGIYMPPEIGYQFTLTELPVTKDASLAQGMN